MLSNSIVGYNEKMLGCKATEQARDEGSVANVRRHSNKYRKKKTKAHVLFCLEDAHRRNKVEQEAKIKRRTKSIEQTKEEGDYI